MLLSRVYSEAKSRRGIRLRRPLLAVLVASLVLFAKLSASDERSINAVEQRVMGIQRIIPGPRPPAF